jgi:PST family polysaccharide transporter
LNPHSESNAGLGQSQPADTKGSNIFQAHGDPGGLRGKAIRGGLVTLLTQAACLVLSVASSAALGRLLTPRDYGLVAMVGAFTAFFSLFKDLGLSQATIQREEITHQQVSTLFWLNASLGAALMAITMLIAPLVAWFYHEPKLVAITAALSAGFLLSGFGVQHSALLVRQMRWPAVSAAGLPIQIITIGVGILLAWRGWGPWALVCMALIGSCLQTLLVWYLCPWRPGMPARRIGARSMVATGGNVTGFQILSYFARNLDQVLIGRVWGGADLGIYSRSYSLFLLPLSQITSPLSSLAVPALSRLQNEPERFRSFLLKALLLVNFVTMPLTVLLMVCAEPVISLLLGAKWMACVNVFRVLGLAGLVQPTVVAVSWIYYSTDATARLFRWGWLYSATIIFSFIIGLPFGIIGVAICYSVAFLLITWPAIAMATHGTCISVRQVLRAVAHPFAGALLAGVAAWLTQLAVGKSLPSWQSLFLELAAGGAIYGLVLFIFFRNTGRTVLSIARELLNG